MFRSLQLLALHNKQSLMRLRYDLGRELVVIISSAVLLGLFAYIFHDFLSEKLLVIPDAQRLRISNGFAACILCLLGPWLASSCWKLWRLEPSFAGFALRAGEVPKTVHSFLCLQTLLIVVSGYALFWWIVGKHWANWAWPTGLGLQLLSLALGGLRLRFVNLSPPATSIKAILHDEPQSRRSTLVSWRWQQILRRNRLARLCLLAAFSILLLMAVLLSIGAPFFLAVLLSMVSGLLVSCAPAFQLEEDMRAIWFERQLGCSHEEYVDVYQRLCLGLALGFGAIACALMLLSLAWQRIGILEALKLFPICALFPAMLPAVMFQLAPERPFLQIMIVGLIGLFFGTAVFAHWGFACALPIALYYAKQYQQNNFYRS